MSRLSSWPSHPPPHMTSTTPECEARDATILRERERETKIFTKTDTKIKDALTMIQHFCNPRIGISQAFNSIMGQSNINIGVKERCLSWKTTVTALNFSNMYLSTHTCASIYNFIVNPMRK